jgi:hypothetical protein
MPEAMSSAFWPGRMRATVPCRTLLTYFVPSGRIARPSLPASVDCSVVSSCPAGENVRTSFEPMLTTTMLPFGSKATPLGRLRGAPVIRIEA